MKKKLGDVCAYITPPSPQQKPYYYKLGVAFVDDQNRISMKIDTLPIPHARWDGWVNILPDREQRLAMAGLPKDEEETADDGTIPF